MSLAAHLSNQTAPKRILAMDGGGIRGDRALRSFLQRMPRDHAAPDRDGRGAEHAELEDRTAPPLGRRRHGRDDDGQEPDRAQDEQQTASCRRVAWVGRARVHARIIAGPMNVRPSG